MRRTDTNRAMSDRTRYLFRRTGFWGVGLSVAAWVGSSFLPADPGSISVIQWGKLHVTLGFPAMLLLFSAGLVVWPNVAEKFFRRRR